jgi:HPt (histidine-containing phosphotransfer) domain-containing protein
MQDEEEKEIMALAAFDINDCLKFGYPKETVLKLVEDFFANQYEKYINEINTFVDSDDRVQMYNTAHKLVGASRYAGVVRVQTIADKMQKYVPKEEKLGPARFEDYRRMHKLLMREYPASVEEYKRYKTGGRSPAPSNALSPMQPQAQQRLGKGEGLRIV